MVYYRLLSCICIVLSIFTIIKNEYFFNVKFILISIPTIYLSYSYSPVATNTNLDP